MSYLSRYPNHKLLSPHWRWHPQGELKAPHDDQAEFTIHSGHMVVVVAYHMSLSGSMSGRVIVLWTSTTRATICVVHIMSTKNKCIMPNDGGVCAVCEHDHQLAEIAPTSLHWPILEENVSVMSKFVFIHIHLNHGCC
jgi:hypothetical protein